jgi:hypothetical protein
LARKIHLTKPLTWGCSTLRALDVSSADFEVSAGQPPAYAEGQNGPRRVDGRPLLAVGLGDDGIEHLHDEALLRAQQLLDALDLL